MRIQMGIRCCCPIGHNFNFKDERAGEFTVCPNCKLRFQIPPQDTQYYELPADPKFEGWYVLWSDGILAGPIGWDLVQHWIKDGRIEGKTRYFHQSDVTEEELEKYRNFSDKAKEHHRKILKESQNINPVSLWGCLFTCIAITGLIMWGVAIAFPLLFGLIICILATVLVHLFKSANN